MLLHIAENYKFVDSQQNYLTFNFERKNFQQIFMKIYIRLIIIIYLSIYINFQNNYMQVASSINEKNEY